MAIKFTSLLAQRSGSMYKERVGERGTAHAQASDKEELDLKIYNTTMALEQSWQIKHDGANASKLIADFANEELESTFPLAKFSGESRIEQKLNVGDLSGANPAIIADASANGAAYLKLDSIFKAEQHATAPKMSIYDIDIEIGSANAQAASKSLTAQLHTYSFEATNEFVAGFSGAYVLSLNMSKAALQSSQEAELKNLSSNQSLQLGADAELKIEEAEYRITDKLSASEIYKVSPRTATTEPLFEQNGNFSYTIATGGPGEGYIRRAGGASTDDLMVIYEDGITIASEFFAVERDPLGAAGPITRMLVKAERYNAEAHTEYVIEQKAGMAQGKFRIEGDIGSLAVNGVSGQSDMLIQHTGAASGKHHIKLSSDGVDIAQKLQVQENAAFAKELLVVDKITGYNDLAISQNASIGGNLVVTGDLTVNGATVEVQGTQVNFQDTIFDMGQDNAGAGTLNASLDLGFMMNYEDAGVAKKSSMYWDTSEKRFKLAAEASETAGIITSSQFAELELGRLYGASAELDLLAADEIRLGKSAASFANAEIGLKVGNAPGSAEFKVSDLLLVDEAADSINSKADNQVIQGSSAAGKLNFEQIEVSINETTQSAWTWYDGQGASKASIFEIGGKLLVGDISSEFSKDLSIGGPLTNGLDIPAPIFSVDGSGYVKNDFEVDGTLYAANASFATSNFQALEADYLHLESDEVRLVMAEPEDALTADLASASVKFFSIFGPASAAANSVDAEIWSSLPLDLDAAADIQGDANLQAKLAVGDAASFADTVSIAKKLTASDAVDLAAAGKATSIFGTLSVAEAASMASTLQVASDLTAQANLSVASQSTLSGDVAMGANASVASDLAVSGQITGALNATISGNVNATDMIASGDISAANDIHSGQDIYVKRSLIPGDKATGAGGVQTVGTAAKPFETGYFADLDSGSGSFANNVTIAGDLTVQGASDLQGDVSAGAKLSVVSDATLSAKLDVAGAASLADTLSVSKAASLADTLSVAKLASFANNIDVIGKADISTDANIGNDASIGGDLSVTGAAFIGMDLDANGAVDIAGKLEFAAAGLTSRSRGSLTIDEDLTVTGASVLSGADFSGDVDIAGKLNVQSDTTVVKLDATGSISTTQGLSVTKSAVISADASVGGQLSVTGDALVGANATITGDAQADNFTALTDGSIGNDLSVGADASIGGNLTVTGDAQVNNLNATVSASTANLTVTVDAAIGQDLSVTRDFTVGRDSSLAGKLSVAGDSDVQNLHVKAQMEVDGDAQFDAALQGTSTTALFEWGGPKSGSQANTAGYNFHVAPAANFAGDVHIDQNLNVDGTVTIGGLALAPGAYVHSDIDMMHDHVIGFRDSLNTKRVVRINGDDDRLHIFSGELDYSWSFEGLEGGIGSNIQVNDPAISAAVSFKAFDLGTITDSGWEPAQAHSAGTSAAKWMICSRANKGISAGVDPMNGGTSALAAGMQYKLNKDNAADVYNKGSIVYLSPAVAGAITKNLPTMEGDHVMIVGKVVVDSPNGTPQAWVAISIHYMYRI